MSEKENKMVTNWLWVVCILIIGMVVVGGFTRLTRSGLSIVEWNPVSGVVPPIGEQQWQDEFAKYKLTPEGATVNKDMTLEGFQRIFYVEYIHRLIARFAGLFVVIPLLYFLWKKIIPWRKSGVYILIALLFGFQGYMGWYMVSSGLEDVPAVDHFRLTIHLLLALSLLALTLWMALNHFYRFPKRVSGVYRTGPYWLSILMIAVLVLQISYGGLVAGLKAGHASNTWPFMFGYLVPPGLFSVVEPWWRNLIEVGATVHFMHRWFAFAVLTAALILFYFTRKRGFSATMQKSVLWLLALIGVQITLGVLTVWLNVNIAVALLHQFTALSLFVLTFFINYRIVHEPLPYPGTLQPRLEFSAGD